MNAPPHSFAVLREARRTARQLVVEHVRCLVYELPSLTYDRLPAPSLVFENDTLVGRVRNFPVEWRALSDCELLAIVPAQPDAFGEEPIRQQEL
jgi:hypothetical protein